MYAKAFGLTAIYLAGYAVPLVFDLNATSVVLIYGFLGVWGVFLGVNVGHDAAHHALFQTRKYNDWAMHIFDLLGLSSFNWKKPSCFWSSCVFPTS